MQTFLVQIKNNLIKFFYSNKNLVPQSQLGKQSGQNIEGNFECPINEKLQLKCQRAKEELKYIKRFTHWPVAELKIKVTENSTCNDINKNHKPE